MSHLSRIKTSITNEEILKKTLKELNFTCINKTINNQQKTITNSNNIIVQQNGKDLFIFSWNGKQYSLLADLQLWNLNIPYAKLLEKITQQYSYNAILKESAKYGFENINQKTLEDGSIQLVIQRWHS
uniref:hypothetical protein n=1 Tax=Hypnea wynnei TaxID=1867777 RepID=UPI0027DA74C4|nr:hypothetical protein REP92_pgp194 [Hypnea wynnei]WCH56433.1 hypothetical protein [Hypnea wynnei]